MKKLLYSILFATLSLSWAAYPQKRVPQNDMHAKTRHWTGFFRIPQREMTLGQLIEKYGEPDFVGKGAYMDFITPLGDTINELYDLVFRNLSHVRKVIRFEWNNIGQNDLVLYFYNANPDSKPVGGYIYSPDIYHIADKYHKGYYYSPRNWDDDGNDIHWDTITKSKDWISFRYLKKYDLSSQNISKKYGAPILIKTGRDVESSLYYSIYRLEGVYGQCFRNNFEDSIIEFVWRLNDYHYLRIYYIKTENGDSAISGYYYDQMVLPE